MAENAAKSKHALPFKKITAKKMAETQHDPLT